MICDSCIHKEVCYEKEEDRQALKHCSDYFNFVDELEKIKEEMLLKRDSVDVFQSAFDWNIKLIEKHIAELKGENK